MVLYQVVRSLALAVLLALALPLEVLLRSQPQVWEVLLPQDQPLLRERQPPHAGVPPSQEVPQSPTASELLASPVLKVLAEVWVAWCVLLVVPCPHH